MSLRVGIVGAEADALNFYLAPLVCVVSRKIWASLATNSPPS